MSNDMTIVNNSDIRVIQNHELGQLIQPLIREIYLFDTYIAGTTHLTDRSVLDNIQDGEELFLQREDNLFDKKAILVLNNKKQKLGYVPERDNVVFSRLMDAGKILKAKIEKITQQDYFTKISIGIYLVDL